ncbi:MAG: hypothetical protein FWD51_00100 [Betaproteobacteria bacterium]|nr:hypothetical protein [Betaproteobacteria bacterium]
MQTGIPVTLPGGLLVDGQRKCDAVLRPLNGWLEEQVSMAMAGRDCLPAIVSEVLGAVLLGIGGEAVMPEQVGSLAMADRQWLMLNLAHTLQGGGYWLKGYCDACEQPFDLYLDPRQLPVKTAGEGFPFVELVLGKNKLHLRLPNGADQERIAGLDADDAVTLLLSACLLSVNGGSVPAGYVDALNADALRRIDEALDEVSPYVGTTLATACPECRQPQQVEINPYLLGTVRHGALFQEVHMLAREYHWSEREILSLSRDRRQLYLRLIERSRNVVT